MNELADKKVGIFGGSFDPIHNGHLAIARAAYEDFSLDEVWFIPAGHSPNKKESDMTPAQIRYEMTALALEEYPYFHACDYEIKAEGTSYTYLTLSHFKEMYPNTTFYFIMGADSLDYFEKWRHPEIICQKAVILTAVRDELGQTEVKDKIESLKQLFTAEIYPLSCPKVDAASSEIRNMIQKNLPVTEMLPKKVIEYIKKNHLYCHSQR